MTSANFNSMNDLFLYLMPALAVLTVLAVLGWEIYQSRIRQRKQKAFEMLLRQLSRTQEQQKKQLNEVQVGALGLGKRLIELEHRLTGLEQHQQELELKEPENRLYTRAMRMVELGADLDELMHECELPRAEAELLLSLHREQTANRQHS